MAEAWYYSAGGAKQGPVDTPELKRLAGSGVIKPETLIWKSGLKEWVKAEKVQGLFTVPMAEPPPLPTTAPPSLPPQAQAVAPAPMAGTIPSAMPVISPSATPQVTAGAAVSASEPNPLLSVILLFACSAVPAAIETLCRLGAPPVLREGLVLAWLAAGITWCVFASIDLYRFWMCVPEQDRVTTPGKAIGFCFIPFFNFYWFFVAFRGLSLCTNKSLAARGLPGTAPVGLATALAITAICCPIAMKMTPFLGLLANAGFMIVGMLWLMGQCDATFALLGRESPSPKLKRWFVGICIGAGIWVLIAIGAASGGSAPLSPWEAQLKDQADYNREMNDRMRQIREAYGQ